MLDIYEVYAKAIGIDITMGHLAKEIGISEQEWATRCSIYWHVTHNPKPLTDFEAAYRRALTSQNTTCYSLTQGSVTDMSS